MATNGKRMSNQEEKERILKGNYGSATVWFKLVMKDGKRIGEQGKKWWKRKLVKHTRKV